VPNVKTKPAAIVQRISKQSVVGDQLRLCKMDPLSKCGRMVPPSARRGICDSDYQTASEQVREGDYKWEELEALGYCNPRRRELQKRILRTILAHRS